MRILGRYGAALGILAALVLAALSPLAHAASGGAPIAYLYCYSGSTPTSPASWAPCNNANPLSVSASVTASVGGFIPSLAYSTLTATASSSASTALPTNTGTVAFQNQTAVAVSCTLASGSATATTNEIIVPASSTVFVGTTGYDHAACINTTGSASNVIVLAGGTGLGTGFGGGSSGAGSGGAVYGPTAGGSAAANPPVLMGGTVDGTTTGNVDNWKVASGIGYITGNLTQGGTALSATNGLFSNILQGNAVLSLTNPLFVTPATGASWAVTGTFYQATQPVSIASAQVASGAYASGSIASGAFASGSIGSGAVASGAIASGAVASGAYASGSLASGAMVDLVATQTPVAPNTATATKGLLAGGTYTSTQPTLTTTQQAALAFTSRNAVLVAPGVDNFAVQLNTTPSLANGNGVVPTQGGTALSATNGMFDNILQGNAVLSATNGLYSNILQGNAALSATNGIYGNLLQGNAVLSSTNPIFSGITDGTNGPAAVKAASTPSPATDKSLSVTMNAGSNGIVALGQATKANSVPVTFASDQDPCSYAQKSSAVINTSSATTTSLVAVSGSTAVYVCGFSLTVNNVVTTASTFKFEYGTGASCTGTTALTGVYNTGSVTAGIPSVISYGGAGATIFTAPASNGVCIVTAGTGDDDGVLTYVQQ